MYYSVNKSLLLCILLYCVIISNYITVYIISITSNTINNVGKVFWGIMPYPGLVVPDVSEECVAFVFRC